MDGDQRLRTVAGQRTDGAGQCVHRIGEQFQGLMIDVCRRLPLGCAIADRPLDRGIQALPGMSRDIRTNVRDDKPGLLKEARGTVDERGSRERLGRRLVHGVQPAAGRQPRTDYAQVPSAAASASCG